MANTKGLPSALVSLNATDTAFPTERLVHELFNERALSHPNSLALIHGDAKISYGELGSRVELLVDSLMAKGVTEDSLVGVDMPRGIDLMITILAVLNCGAAYLPIDHTYPLQRVLHMTSDSKCQFVVTNSSTSDTFSKRDDSFVLLAYDSLSPPNNKSASVKLRSESRSKSGKHVSQESRDSDMMRVDGNVAIMVLLEMLVMTVTISLL